MYAEDHVKYGIKQDCFIYIAVNAHWEEHRFELPALPGGYEWRLAFEAYGLSTDAGHEKKHEDQSCITIGARSTAILISVLTKDGSR
jgi:glycogen operon protein